jgi:hypothetical protein
MSLVEVAPERHDPCVSIIADNIARIVESARLARWRRTRSALRASDMFYRHRSLSSREVVDTVLVLFGSLLMLGARCLWQKSSQCRQVGSHSGNCFSVGHRSTTWK